MRTRALNTFLLIGFKEEQDMLRKAIKVPHMNDEGSALRQTAKSGHVDLLVSYSMNGVKHADGVDVVRMPEDLDALLGFIKRRVVSA